MQTIALAICGILSFLWSSTGVLEAECERNETGDRALLQVRASRVRSRLTIDGNRSIPTFYLSPNGNDAMGDGTRGNPYRTLFAILRHQRDTLMEHGGRIYLRGGVHRWAGGEGRIEGLKFGGKGLLIASDPDDSYPAVLSGTVEIKQSWEHHTHGQWDPKKAQRDTQVWCSPLPSRIEDGVRVAVWVDYGSGLELAPQAQLPHVEYEVDRVDWPWTSLMSDLVIPQSHHAFSDNLLQASLDVKLSAPPWCKHNCDEDCQAITGGSGCPRMRHLPACGVNTAWLRDKERFGDTSKNFSGGFLDIGLCSSKSILKYMPIIAHDVRGGRVQFDYSKYACDHDDPAKKTEMWQGDHSCWKAGKLESAEKPKYRVYSQAEQDRINEWFIIPRGDATIPEVCIRLKSNPGSEKGPGVHVRMRGPALELMGSENIHVDNVHFFASEMTNSVNENTGLGRNNVFAQLSLLYPGRITLGPAVLLDSEVRFGSGISFSGWMGSSHHAGPCRMENTLLEYSWHGVELWDCSGGSVKFNTIRKIQNGNGMHIDFHTDRGAAVKDYIGKEGLEISFNRIHDIGFAELSDGNGLLARSGAYKGMRYYSNWIYQMPSYTATLLDSSDNGGDLFRNVFWKTTKGLVAKGGVHEGNRIVHNTGFYNKECDFSVLESDYGKKCNEKSEVFNNAGNDWRDFGLAHCSKPVCAKPCQSGNNSVHFNVCTDHWPRVEDMLRDVSVFDFRPLGDSKLRGAANKNFITMAPGKGVEQTVGAYESRGGHYSIPGRMELHSSSPIPPHGFPSAFDTQNLMWNRGSKAVAHDVFLGMSYCAILQAKRDDHSLLFERFVWPDNIANVTLEMGVRYYWRVDAVGDDGITVKGDVWCFRVSDTGERTLDVPWNMVTGIDYCASLKPSSCLHGSAAEPMRTLDRGSSSAANPISWKKNCPSMTRHERCTDGEVNVFPIKVLTSDACIELCTSHSWSGQVCCTWMENGLCRVHNGSFSIDEASEKWYAAACSGIDTLPPVLSTTTTTTSHLVRPQCTDMQARRICTDGEIQSLGDLSSAQACRSLCETMTTPTSNCCVWYQITEACRLHSGEFKRYPKDKFYAADCSEDATSLQ